jgi:hypothetical protein
MFERFTSAIRIFRWILNSEKIKTHQYKNDPLLTELIVLVDINTFMATCNYHFCASMRIQFEAWPLFTMSVLVSIQSEAWPLFIMPVPSTWLLSTIFKAASRLLSGTGHKSQRRWEQKFRKFITSVRHVRGLDAHCRNVSNPG